MHGLQRLVLYAWAESTQGQSMQVTGSICAHVLGFLVTNAAKHAALIRDCRRHPTQHSAQPEHCRQYRAADTGTRCRNKVSCVAKPAMAVGQVLLSLLI
jgi:hypothetical protein